MSLSSRTVSRSSRGTSASCDRVRSGTGKMSAYVMPCETTSSTRTHAAAWPLSTRSRSGSAVRQASMASGQRGANGQPGGRLTTEGGLPSRVASASWLPWSRRGTDPSRPIVYGMAGR